LLTICSTNRHTIPKFLRASNSGVWSAPKLIETGPRDPARAIIALDVAGNAIVVWQEYDGSNTDIYFNRYDRAAGVQFVPL